MKAGWEVKRLGEVCGFQNGFAFKSGLFRESGYPILRISNIQDDVVETRRVVYFRTEDYKENLERYRVIKGDLLIAMSGGTTGKIGFNTTDQLYYLNQRVGKFEPKTCLSKKYLFYFLSTRIEENLRISAGSAQPNLSTEQIKDFEIPLPKIPEQQRIVAILDEAFASIATAKANAEKNLQNARALFESHLQSVFTQRGEGWVEKSLEELGTITSSKRIFKNEYVKSGVPFYRTKEIKELANSKEITTELFIPETRYKEIKASFGVPKQGDILLTAIGTIGEIYVVKGDEDFYFKDGNVLWLKEFDAINPYFLKYVLISFVERLNKMAHGSAYSALPIQRLNAHKIFVPSPKEQEAIVTQLDALNVQTQRLESIYQQKLAALSALKKSLLDQAFSGEL